MRYLAILLLAACTSSSPKSGGGSVTATGTLGGAAVDFRSAGAQVVTDSKGSFVMVYLSSYEDACSAPAVAMASSSAVEISLYKAGSGGALVAATDPGAYTTDVSSAGPWAEIDTLDRDASCMATAAEGKGDGTVTLTQVNAGGYSGTFDFTHGSDHVTGSFTAAPCPSQLPVKLCQ